MRDGMNRYDALTRIGDNRFRGLPFYERKRCVGLISSFKISRYLFPHRDQASTTREVHASLRISLIHRGDSAGRPDRQ